MAPISQIRRRRGGRVSRKRELETESGVWAWTLGDDSDSEDDGRINLMPKRRIRRQAPPPPAPVEGDAPPPSPPASGVPVIDTASSSSESDGISSNTSGDEEEVEEVEGTASGSQVSRPLGSHLMNQTDHPAANGSILIDCFYDHSQPEFHHSDPWVCRRGSQ